MRVRTLRGRHRMRRRTASRGRRGTAGPGRARARESINRNAELFKRVDIAMEATEAAPSPLCAPGAHLRHPQPSSGVPESARPCDVTGPGATHGPRTCPRPGWWGPTRTPPSAPPPHQRPRLVPGRPQRPAWGDPSAPTPVRRLPAMKTRHPPYMQYLSVCLSVCPSCTHTRNTPSSRLEIEMQVAEWHTLQVTNEDPSLFVRESGCDFESILSSFEEGKDSQKAVNM